MKLTGTNIVIDTAWGDSGKGKFVDVFSGDADLIIRFNGGANAGHTVVNDYGEFKFHLIPTGIFNPNALSILAGSVALSPLTLVKEINELRKKGVEISAKNLLISEYAHMVMPWHIARDNLREAARANVKVGTTGRGIGPLYADRTERVGVRMGDMLKNNFEEIVLRELAWQKQLIELMDAESPSSYAAMLTEEKVLENLRQVRDTLVPMIGNPLPKIWVAQKAGKRILGEGAQGILLDIDLGTYPFVTSSHPGVTGFSIATGLQQNDIQRVIGVTKAYQTRVGEGPMPTELLGEIGEKLRELGNEYGATTGRPRRCGWLDLPALRYSLQVGGVNSIALTKIDVLDGMDEIKICTHYEYNGVRYDTLPTADAVFMEEATAIYKIMPKWDGATEGVKDFADFPKEARDYVRFIEESVGVPIEIISNGPARDEVLYKSI